MAKRQGRIAVAVTDGNRKYIAYGVACFLCVMAGAYIGHSSQETLAEELAVQSPAQQTGSTGAEQLSASLEIKYAYFGASSIQMPSEKNTIATPSQTLKPQPKPTAQASGATTQTAALSPANQKNQQDRSANDAETQSQVAQPSTNFATVARGDTFSTIGQSFGLSVRETANIMQDELASEHLKTIIPGEHITFKSGDDNTTEQIIYIIDDSRTLILDRIGEAKFIATLDEVALQRRTIVKMGVVENSLFLSAAKAGVSNRHIMQMVDIFRWDIDFAMDVQPNDTFKLAYEGYYKDSQLVRTGRLLGAEFKGRSMHQALYFNNDDNEGAYYTARGRQLQKQFLRNPVDTVRITSHFNPQRKHPVLNTIKAHKGVDYGAPIGTPIKATADGIVKYSGRRGTFGLAVILQHGKRYTTLYAHMNKIHQNTTVGTKVKQGQIIGYVGKTGRVTGAHLHYEFRVKGVHVNPQTVKFAGAGSVPKKEQRQFNAATGPILEQMNRLNPTTFALSQQP